MKDIKSIDKKEERGRERRKERKIKKSRIIKKEEK